VKTVASRVLFVLAISAGLAACQSGGSSDSSNNSYQSGYLDGTLHVQAEGRPPEEQVESECTALLANEESKPGGDSFVGSDTSAWMGGCVAALKGQ
jgi:ABC-type glycerol-3-phosphate transport system substrate-binding protein